MVETVIGRSPGSRGVTLTSLDMEHAPMNNYFLFHFFFNCTQIIWQRASPQERFLRYCAYQETSASFRISGNLKLFSSTFKSTFREENGNLTPLVSYETPNAKVR